MKTITTTTNILQRPLPHLFLSKKTYEDDKMVYEICFWLWKYGCYCASTIFKSLDLFIYNLPQLFPATFI